MAIQITSSIKPQAAVKMIQQEQANALRDVGRFVRAQAAKYPPKADSTFYKRTGTLGRSIAVGPMRVGAAGSRYVEVGTNKHYARYVEYGTGIYGPKKTKIVPKTARVLAWQSQARFLYGVRGGKMGPMGHVGLALAAAGLSQRKGKIRRNYSRDVYTVFARSVRGMKPWHFMEQAFKAPETQVYFQQRLQQMQARIRVAL